MPTSGKLKFPTKIYSTQYIGRVRLDSSPPNKAKWHMRSCVIFCRLYRSILCHPMAHIRSVSCHPVQHRINPMQTWWIDCADTRWTFPGWHEMINPMLTQDEWSCADTSDQSCAETRWTFPGWYKMINPMLTRDEHSNADMRWCSGADTRWSIPCGHKINDPGRTTRWSILYWHKMINPMLTWDDRSSVDTKWSINCWHKMID